MAAIVSGSGGAVTATGGKLLDVPGRCVETGETQAVELVAAAPQSECLVDRHVAALEARHDSLQLLLCGLEGELGGLGAQGRIFSAQARESAEAYSRTREDP
jgi:hypothetical protein